MPSGVEPYRTDWFIKNITFSHFFSDATFKKYVCCAPKFFHTTKKSELNSSQLFEMPGLPFMVKSFDIAFHIYFVGWV